ncbi:MAG: hypothetical protein M3R38_29840 [Actinomycetota bacterium]|nr:hypothetical protein [Actinomycetota bacterium]
MASEAASEAVLLLLAITVAAFTAPAILVSLVYSIPYAVRRIRRYSERGSARRLFAEFTLFQTVIPTFCLVLFFSVGIILAVMDDTAARAAATRILLLGGIALLSLQVVVSPIGHKYIEAAAQRERDKINNRKDC